METFQTPFHAFIKARELANSGDLLAVYASSNIEVYPYQVAATQFAMRSPYLKGVVLCDEGSLGKTYEAMLIAVQKWYDGAKIAIVVTIPLYMQWKRLIEDKFTVPLDELNLMTYEDAIADTDKLTGCDVIIFDEAHYLKNHETKKAVTLKNATAGAYKILLTATPMQTSIMDLFGLIHFIDDTVLGDADEFYRRYYRKPENYHELSERVSRYCFRTTRAQVHNYTKIPRRIPITIEYSMSDIEQELYNLIEKYLDRETKSAFPDMDEHRLALSMFRNFSSSSAALVKFLSGVIERLGVECRNENAECRNEELGQIREMLIFAESIAEDTKASLLVKALKSIFPDICKFGANKKALIFTESRETQKYITDYLSHSGFNVLSYNGSNTRDYETIDKFQSEAEILVATDIAAEGLNLEFCSLVINYDMPYNVLETEQRITRCHRQGQENDVIVLSFMSKDNYADRRTLEIANKRLEQYQGIIGMTDKVMGNFGADVLEVIRLNARHKDDIQREFADILARHRDANEALVNEAENVLFTSFTSEVAKSVMVTPKYITEKIEQINAELWAVTKTFLSKCGYIIDEAAKTATLPPDAKQSVLFYYWTGSRNSSYKGFRKYGAGKDFKPVSGRVTLTSPIGRGVLHNIECADDGSLSIHNSQCIIHNCKIGFYIVRVGDTEYLTFTGLTDAGDVLSEDECRRILSLPVSEFSENGNKSPSWLKNSTGRPSDKLDKLVDTGYFIQKQLENRTSAQNEEISRMREANNRKKAYLERNLNAIRAELKSLQSKTGNDLSRHEAMKAERKNALLIKRIKDTEKSLHHEKMKLEQELRTEVETFLGKSKLTARIYRQFVLDINGG